MENKAQIKEVKSRKKNSKNAAKKSSVRITADQKQWADDFLEKANSKKFGRSIKFEDAFQLFLEEMNERHMEILRERSLTGDDRKEILRQKYIEQNGQISKADFTEFMMKPEYLEFMRSQGLWEKVAA